VHWISNDNAIDGVLLVPTEKEVESLKGKIEIHNYPVGTMVQIERIGYARVVDNSTLMFTHS